MITSLTEMLELPNFSHMTAFTFYFESHDKILLATSWTEIQKSFTLRRPEVGTFADIIKIVTMFIKTILKDSS